MGGPRKNCLKPRYCSYLDPPVFHKPLVNRKPSQANLRPLAQDADLERIYVIGQHVDYLCKRFDEIYEGRRSPAKTSIDKAVDILRDIKVRKLTEKVEVQRKRLKLVDVPDTNKFKVVRVVDDAPPDYKYLPPKEY